MTWEYQIDFPPDDGVGARFYVAQEAEWEQVGLAWNKPPIGDVVYGAQSVDIGAAGQDTATEIGVHFSPFSMIVRMQYKAGPSPDNQGLPWCSSALNLLYQGPQDGSQNALDVAGRPNLIKIGAENDPLHNQQVGGAFTEVNPWRETRS